MDFDIVDELPDSQGRKSGWEPLVDAESKQFKDKHQLNLPPHLMLPLQVDLRGSMPPIYDQGPLNSCTSNAISAMLQYLRMKQHMNAFLPSRLYLYWYQRLATGTQAQNAGCSVVSALTVASTHGYCPDIDFPYGPAYQNPPPPRADSEALHHKVGTFSAPVDFGQLKLALASGFPVAFGFYYFNSFFQADLNGGMIPMRQPTDVGAVKHAALLVGYSDATQTMIVRNSWGLTRQDGKQCGDHGYYYLPYAYLNDGQLCSEFWTGTSVTDIP